MADPRRRFLFWDLFRARRRGNGASSPLEGVEFSPAELSEAEREAWSAQIRERAFGDRPAALGRQRRLRGWVGGLAATLLLLLLAGGAWYYQYGGQRTLATDYGEQRELTLPDGSRVTLNANSTLRYDKRWSETATRAVWLEGEAYFEVSETPTAGAQKFVVHTDNLEVAVVGTKFNVFHRRGRTQVVLKEGAVRLYVPGTDPTTADTLVMQPQELVEVHPDQPGPRREVVDAADYAAWTERKLIFRDTPLPEVAQQIEDLYGVPVRLGANAARLDTLRLSGEVRTDDINTVLTAIDKLFDLEVTRTDAGVRIDDR